MTVLADSDILIEVLRSRNEAILNRWIETAQSDTELACSPVSHAELWRGARPSERATIIELLNSLECAPIDGSIGETAGDLLRQYAKSHGLDLGDALIAATALRNGAVLWTRNRKHYPMPGISFY